MTCRLPEAARDEEDTVTTSETTTQPLLDGRYRLLDTIGRGGMATVYRAQDEVLGRTVAVKMIRHRDDATASADRAHVEKAALASLSRPALVTLFDSRLEPGRAQYLVTEYIDGPTLAAVLARGSLPAPEVARIAADLAGALQTVHAAGLIHRDVKPSNILLRTPRRVGGHWAATLADFGIACAVGASRLTSPGVVLGTVAYMAPEQLRGAELTPAVDVYALGLVLIEALTGEPGYASSTGVESALVRLSVPPTISDAVDARWRDLLTSMTSIEPADRPSAGEVEACIRSLADEGAAPLASAPSAAASAPVTATATLPLPRPVDSARRRRAPRRCSVAVLAAAAASAAIVGGAVLSPPTTGSPARRRRHDGAHSRRADPAR